LTWKKAQTVLGLANASTGYQSKHYYLVLFTNCKLVSSTT
jgi:hypothetical protein